MADAPPFLPASYNGGFAPLSSWGGTSASNNPALADILNRGWTNTGTSWNAQTPQPYTGTQFSSYGGAPLPYATLQDQITDAMRVPTTYAQSWPWGNGAQRYGFGGGQTTPMPAGGGSPAGAGGGTGGLLGLPTTAPSMPPPSSGAPAPAPAPAPAHAPAPAQGFWPTPAAPAGTPPPTSLTPQPGGAQPQQQDGALAYLLRKGYTPAAAQARVAYMASGPQQLSQWNQLGDDTARGQYLNTHPGFARELLNSGNMSNAQSTLYSLLALGGSGR